MTRPVPCIRERLSRERAEGIVASASGHAARVQRALYYPYLWYRPCYSVATLFGRPRFQIDCLVDARQGLVSTADAFETREVSPPPVDVLEACVDSDTAEAAARRTLGHELGKKHRSATRLELGRGRLLYKKFWIVGCSTDGTQVLLDSTSGQFIALTDTAA